jgi:hypothetical protein
MTTTALNIQKIVKARVESINLPRANWKVMFFVGLFFVVLLLTSYTFLVINLTKGAYLTNNYEKKIKLLSAENKKLQLTFAENSFLGYVDVKAENLNFEKTTSIKYIQVLDNSLAVAK